MARAWLVTGRGIARKIKSCSGGGGGGDFDCLNRECPNCKQLIDNNDVATSDWPGFPAGVKFDPSDVELLEHLAARIGLGNSKPHVLIDEFIPTLEDDAGICYTHPQNLPGAEKDGSGSAHFFHRISSAYAKGPRKRRRISRCGSSEEPAVRWHKTGRTKLVLDINGVQKGWKKIMVLHESSKGVAKPDRAKWVMHQYHIGAGEDESEGQLVVSKVFYQRIQSRNPSTSSPRPLRRPEIGIESVSQAEYAFDSEVNGTNARGFADLDEILVDTPPDFQLSDLQFGSQESAMSWLEQY
ncbi:SUPPRESSOR OF GAMMA RESPONSE 1-like [Zingiber officinale]|uniref:SUPPRESSOR OF GAMMA RESPONSE 1-like n=1 Tax=Zingiber officinale TaxID=94328 RepID=UPI001C4B6D3E|nr:SUPPRESSOR OF GAMMA RESPONSE 1-like [Zingiber officinale]